MAENIIRVDFVGELTALPCPSQLTYETIRESYEKSVEEGRALASAPEYRAIGVCIGEGEERIDYTILRFTLGDGRRVEVRALARLAHRSVELLEVGSRYKVRCELTGQEPHYGLRLVDFRAERAG